MRGAGTTTDSYHYLHVVNPSCLFGNSLEDQNFGPLHQPNQWRIPTYRNAFVGLSLAEKFNLLPSTGRSVEAEPRSSANGSANQNRTPKFAFSHMCASASHNLQETQVQVEGLYGEGATRVITKFGNTKSESLNPITTTTNTTICCSNLMNDQFCFVIL